MNTALIVEDSLSEQEIISGCLLQGGLNVLKANNAEKPSQESATRNRM
jgi:CheY-like chemotaxis protein